MLHKNFCKNGLTAVALATTIAYVPVSSAALTSYSQDWEGVDPTTAAVIGDSFVIGNIIVNTGGEWFVGEAAPNSPVAGVNGYSAFVTGEGGAAQGNNQLSIFSDYNSWSPFNTPGTTLQTFVYKDMGFIDVGEAGSTYSLSFDAKANGLDLSVGSSAWAFVKVLDSVGGTYGTIFESQFDSNTLTADWSGGTASMLVDAAWAGQLVQIGFATEATDWGGTGVLYDNLCFNNDGSCTAPAVPVPAAAWLFGSGLLGLVGVARRVNRS